MSLRQEQRAGPPGPTDSDWTSTIVKVGKAPISILHKRQGPARLHQHPPERCRPHLGRLRTYPRSDIQTSHHLVHLGCGGQSPVWRRSRPLRYRLPAPRLQQLILYEDAVLPPHSIPHPTLTPGHLLVRLPQDQWAMRAHRAVHPSPTFPPTPPRLLPHHVGGFGPPLLPKHLPPCENEVKVTRISTFWSRGMWKEALRMRRRCTRQEERSRVLGCSGIWRMGMTGLEAGERKL